MTGREAGTPPRQLNGWKEIAAFFGKSPRTVQRWETELDLPVRRLKGPAGEIIYAFEDELESWRDTRSRIPETAARLLRDDSPSEGDDSDGVRLPVAPSSTSGSRRRGLTALSVAAVVAVLLLVALTVVWRRLSAGAVVSAEYSEAAIVARDAAGRVVWSFEPGHKLARFDLARVPRSRSLERAPRVVDLDGDGRPEVLAVVGREVPGLLVPRQTLFCLSETGTVRWTFTPDVQRTFGGRVFGPPWLMTDLAFTFRGSEATVWVSVIHSLWWPSFVVRISGTGDASIAMTNAGAIYALEPVTPGGTGDSPVLAVGVNNEWGSAMAVVLRPDGLPLMSPRGTAAEFACTDCRGRSPAQYTLLPRSELNLADPFLPYNMAVGLAWIDGRLVVQTLESEHYNVFANHSLSPDATRVESFDLFDGASKAHDTLQAEGRLSHPWSECLARREQEVRYWNGNGGWESSRVGRR